MAWLDSVNKEREQRGASRLERCLSANRDVFRVPWEDLVRPQFPSRAQSALKEDKESSINDTDMLINTSHDLCRDKIPMGQEKIKHLPFSTRNNQSSVSSEAEDSEGEYVELTELPVPRFSPQKGSLTQCISLQHRSRTSPHATQHTPHNTQTPLNNHTDSLPILVNYHTGLCPKLIKENLSQEAVILSPISSTTLTTSSASPGILGTSSIHLEQQTSQEHTQGIESVRCEMLDTKPENCRGLEEEEVEGQRGEKQDGRAREDETSEKREDEELMERLERMQGMVMSVDEVVKMEEKEQSEEDGKIEEQVDESQGTEGEEEFDEDVDDAAEVELEEEVQVIIMQQNQERRKQEQIQEEKEKEKGEDEERKGHERYIDEADSCLNTLSGNSYSENNALHTHSRHSEKVTLHAHSEDSYSKNYNTTMITLHTHVHPEVANSENITQRKHSDQNTLLQMLSKDSYFENTQKTLSMDCYCENTTLHIHCEDPYSENTSEQIHSEDTKGSITPVKDPHSLSTGNGEQREENSCEEVGGGRTAELQTEGLSSDSVQSEVQLSNCPSHQEQPPLCPELDQSAAAPILSPQTPQPTQSSFYNVLLNSGAICLPGTRDRNGRALLTLWTRSSVWSSPDFDRHELLRLLLYYISTLSRKEVRALGLTVLLDARRGSPVPALFSALRSLQEKTPGCIHTVLLLASKDFSCVCVDKLAVAQVEVVNSLKSLQRHVELRQLPVELGGSFSFSQTSWLCFRSRVEQLTNQCDDIINLLQKTINILQTTPLPAAAQDAQLLLSRYKALMHSVLEDSRLVWLQQEGGASLSQLRREESGIRVTEDYQTGVEMVSSLYNQVDELLHRLVTLSNSRTQELNFIVGFRSLEQGFTEVSSWLQEVGESCLETLDEPEDSLELLNKKQEDFKDFCATAHAYCKRGKALLGHLKQWENVSSADLHIYEVKVHSFRAQLQDFLQRVNATGQNLERAIQLYRFFDQAYGWALEGMRHLAGISMEECTLPDKCQAVIDFLEDYQSRHPPIPDPRFQEMKSAAAELRGERGLCQWSFAWSKCQEMKKMFDRKMQVAIRTRDSAQITCSHPTPIRSSTSSRKKQSRPWRVRETTSSCLRENTDISLSPCKSSSLLPLTSSPITSNPAPSTCSPQTTQHTPFLHTLLHSSTVEDSPDKVNIFSSIPSLPPLDSSASFAPSSGSFCSSRRQQLRKTQSFDCPSTPEVLRYGHCSRGLGEPGRRGNTGVFIRGLEVSSTEAANHTLYPRMSANSWLGQGSSSPGTPSPPRTTNSPAAEPGPSGSKQRHIVEEMVTTEREYVRSLQYIIHHYFPEMDRIDLPQDLRGKRSVIFGNLEKLLDFHSQFFLRELESCWKHPLRVPHCFLRHEQFSLYALYSKNKPKSDTLLANHGKSFFRRKQLELGDKMDLSSYLLKPIQRMSKYALLLSDLIKEVDASQEAELVSLQGATNMVKFQLRHGNDLLAMDTIRDCDVNLKEQGQLIRQDEFTVWTGRRKCQRHIFLFEELVLFSKPKKMEGGLDVFVYKHSFKTADVGLTESMGDSGLKFEIWFRRRTSKNQSYILQAVTPDVKRAWTSDISRILWNQATRNKEMRLKEMVSMGVGSKPFLDIQPSDAAISDRAVHYIMKSRGARTRASIAVSVFDHSNPFKRGVLTSELTATGPSSTSLLGPLNLHMYSQTLSPSPAADTSFNTSCIEEDEQEHETSSQPSMTTDSSGSSSRCLTGSTGSDSGCVSNNLQEALPEEPIPPGQPSSSFSRKQHLSSQYISSKPAALISPATIV